VIGSEPHEQVKSEVKTENNTGGTSASATQNSKSLATIISQFSPDLVKRILELLCDESVSVSLSDVNSY